MELFLSRKPKRVLDVGAGEGRHAEIMRSEGIEVEEIRLPEDYMDKTYSDLDGIWCCHVLEHQRNPGAFLSKIKEELKPGGWLCITVPPFKHNVVGGHVTLWNEGILLYNLILAGFDCADARVGVYGYNISVLVRNFDIELPELSMDKGDIEKLSQFFPCEVHQNFDGRTGAINWR